MIGLTLFGGGLMYAGQEDNVEAFGFYLDPDEDDHLLAIGALVALGNTVVSQ